MATVDQSGLKKKKRNGPYFQLPNFEFKMYVYFFFVFLYSILHCQVHHGLKDKKKSSVGEYDC